MTETATDPRAEVLRAAGHTEAADLLDSLNRLDVKPVPADPAPEQEPAPARRYATQEDVDEAERQAVGAQLLARAKEQIPTSFADR